MLCACEGAALCDAHAMAARLIPPLVLLLTAAPALAAGTAPVPEAPAEMKLTRVVPDRPFVVKEIARYADGTSEWEAEGGLLERQLARFDMENTEAVLYVHNFLEKHGVLPQLRAAGVKHGDLVHAGDIAFAFEE